MQQQQRVTPLTVRTTTIMTTPKHVSTSSGTYSVDHYFYYFRFLELRMMHVSLTSVGRIKSKQILQLVLVVTSSALSGQHLVTAGSSSTASSSGCTSPAHVSAEDRAVLSRGITRSSASYGIQQMLQEQVSQSTNRSIVDKVKSLSLDYPVKKGKATFFSFSFKLSCEKEIALSHFFLLPDNPRGA